MKESWKILLEFFPHNSLISQYLVKLTTHKKHATIKVMKEKKTQNGYSKRPLWQWIAIYAVIGIILYGAVYYFFLAKKDGYSYSSSSNSSYTNYSK